MKAITMTDIADSCGGFVTEDAYRGRLTQDQESDYVWSNQIRPPPRHWRIW